MSVNVREYRGGGWEVDIRLQLPDGTPLRERRKATVSSKSGAQRWGKARERHLLLHGRPKKKEEVTTLKQFAPEFLDGHARANQQKPSSIASKETILRVHLIPAFGDMKLDAIKNEDVQRLKGILREKSPKTVNNVLTVLNVLLKQAVEWGVIEKLPCSIRLLRMVRTEAAFHEFGSYERLVSAARSIGWRTQLIVLLAGEAGLRVGEIVALNWADVDFARVSFARAIPIGAAS